MGSPRASQRPLAATAARSRSPRTGTCARSAKAEQRRVLVRPPPPRCCLAALRRRSPATQSRAEARLEKRRLGLRGALRRSRTHRRSRRRCGCGHGEGCGNVPVRPASRARERARDLASGAELCFVALEGATPSASPPKAPRRAPRLVPRSATRSRTWSRRARPSRATQPKSLARCSPCRAPSWAPSRAPWSATSSLRAQHSRSWGWRRPITAGAVELVERTWRGTIFFGKVSPLDLLNCAALDRRRATRDAAAARSSVCKRARAGAAARRRRLPRRSARCSCGARRRGPVLRARHRRHPLRRNAMLACDALGAALLQVLAGAARAAQRGADGARRAARPRTRRGHLDRPVDVDAGA